MLHRAIPVLLMLLIAPVPAYAGEEKKAEPIPDPEVFTSDHQGRFNGTAVRYSVTAGETYLKDDKGAPKASIFSFAYTRSGADAAGRPVTFVWNGGPGSSSVWLHMGAFGPKRVLVPSDAEDAGLPPYGSEDNGLALLDVTDLVFVDPVGTGFSRALGTHEGKEFWSLEGDTGSISQFIRQWLSANKRWNSPKYLLGESFGTTRAAAVAGELEGNNPTVRLNGLILVSQALDYTGSTPSHDNFIAYVTYLPSLALAARYHGRAGQGKSVEEFAEEARDFAYNQYAAALLKGNLLDEGERQRIAERLAYFTGLDRDYILSADLRILTGRFVKELLRTDGLSIGRLDGRYKGDDIDDVSDRAEADYASAAIGAAYTAMLNQYMAGDLGITIDRSYNISNGDIGRNWIWRSAPEGSFWEPEYVNVARTLSEAMRLNPSMKVLVTNGYYDLITPFFDAEYTFARHGIPKDRIKMTYYEAGHMMYVHQPSFEKLMQDVRAFIGSE